MEVTLRAFSLLVIVTHLVGHLEGYRYFQDKIPNGNNIPHPCKPNYVWQGVGHKNSAGGGERNPFGLAFNANGKVWTPELCNADSDNDGRTNGQELGDPNCVWTEGAIPEESSGLSHPGVCEPWNSAVCLAQNQWEFCDSQEFSCPPMDATNDVRNITLRFPSTTVPSKETTYICYTMPLPDDGDFHLIAQTPIIDNINVMHHMILYGCRDEELAGGKNDVRTVFKTPALCNMGVGCDNILATWALGAPGECAPEQAAFRIGTKGYKMAVLQMHWNNPELRSDYVDSSGMTLYYTPNLRQFDAGYLMTGQEHIVIPPGQPSFITSSVAESYCTQRYLNDTIFLTESSLHMHYLGKSGSLEQYRDGKRLRSLGQDEVYSYDSPVAHRFDPPVEFRPGDELLLKCEFDSTSRTETTYFGDATSDEMCYGFLVYYPEVKNMNSINQNKNTSVCKALFSETCPDIWHYMQGDALEKLWDDVIMFCELQVGGRCVPECENVVRRIKATDGCLSDNDVVDVMKEYLGDDFDMILRGFESCDDVIARNETTITPGSICDLETYMDQTLDGVAERVVASCDVMGVNCKSECKEMIRQIRREDRCLGNAGLAAIMKNYTAGVTDINYFWQSFESCDAELAQEDFKNCSDIVRYVLSNTEKFSKEIAEKCDMEVGGKCRPTCKEMVKKTRETDGCLGNPEHVKIMKLYTLDYEDMDYVWRGFESCDDEIAKEEALNENDNDTTGSASSVSPAFTLLAVVGLQMAFL